MTHDIHSIAERYLRDLASGKAPFYSPSDETEICNLADSIKEPVVVIRSQSPQYLVGFKPSGRPVYSHDLKLAHTFDSASSALSDALTKLKTYGESPEIMPAVWPSNIWNG